MIINGLDVELSAIRQVAELMASAARTAPKGCGIDNLEVRLVDGQEKSALGEEMRRIGRETNVDFFVRDGYNVDRAALVVLLGARISPIFCPNCGYCGYADCEENIKNDGICMFNVTDLGIALGSAVSVASAHKVDNRILFSAGKAALNLGFFPGNCTIVYGIPLSVSSKSPFFDRESGACEGLDPGPEA